MAKVITQVVGGAVKQDVQATTVGGLRASLGLDKSYTAKVNKESRSDEHELEDGDFISFAASVKGGV